MTKPLSGSRFSWEKPLSGTHSSLTKPLSGSRISWVKPPSGHRRFSPLRSRFRHSRSPRSYRSRSRSPQRKSRCRSPWPHKSRCRSPQHNSVQRGKPRSGENYKYERSPVRLNRQIRCYNCGGRGHHFKDCRIPKNFKFCFRCNKRKTASMRVAWMLKSGFLLHFVNVQNYKYLVCFQNAILNFSICFLVLVLINFVHSIAWVPKKSSCRQERPVKQRLIIAVLHRHKRKRDSIWNYFSYDDECRKMKCLKCSFLQLLLLFVAHILNQVMTIVIKNIALSRATMTRKKKTSTK